MAEKAELIITALQQRIGEIVSKTVDYKKQVKLQEDQKSLVCL